MLSLSMGTVTEGQLICLFTGCEDLLEWFMGYQTHRVMSSIQLKLICFLESLKIVRVSIIAITAWLYQLKKISIGIVVYAFSHIHIRLLCGPPHVTKKQSGTNEFRVKLCFENCLFSVCLVSFCSRLLPTAAAAGWFGPDKRVWQLNAKSVREWNGMESLVWFSACSKTFSLQLCSLAYKVCLLLNLLANGIILPQILLSLSLYERAKRKIIPVLIDKNNYVVLYPEKYSTSWLKANKKKTVCKSMRVCNFLISSNPCHCRKGGRVVMAI